jgi:TolB-like protein/tetratricopeptide (TPR) repeat protein
VTEHRASVPPGLGDVLMRCLEKKPADRWQTAEELLGQLELHATPTTGITPTQMTPARATTGTPTWMKVAVPAAVLVAAVALWVGIGDRVSQDGAAGPDAAVLDSGFVVLPFLNQTGVDSLETFGAMLADFLVGQISRNQIGWVTPSATVRELDAIRPSGSEVVRFFSEQSGARYVVTGSYFRQGESLLVQAEVTDGHSAELVTTVGPVEGQTTDLVGTAAMSAERLLVSLARILNPAAAPPGLAGAPRSFSAYRDYQAGAELWEQGERAEALELFYRAIDADSSYVEAIIFASTTEWNLDDIAMGDTVLELARPYRDQMAPWDRANFDWLQGFYDGDREAIYRAGRRFAELDPVRGGDLRGARMSGHYAEAVDAAGKWYDRVFDKAGMLGFFWGDFLTSLHMLGEHEKELEHARTARDIFPAEQRAFTYEARALAALGRLDELATLVDEAGTYSFSVGAVLREAGLELRAHGAAAAGEEYLEASLRWYEEREIENTGPVATLLALKRFEQARDRARQGVTDFPENAFYHGALGMAAAALGDTEVATAMDAGLVELEARPYVFGGPASWRPRIAAHAGDLARAMELLEEAYGHGMTFGTWIHTDPGMDPLRGHPPFQRFIAPRE